MIFIYLLMALIGVAATVFAVQNIENVSVHFLAWSTTGLPLAFVILVSAFIGIVFASTSAFGTQFKQRRKIRQLEAQVAQLLEARRADAETVRHLETRLTEAETARLRATAPPPPAPPPGPTSPPLVAQPGLASRSPVPPPR